MLTVVKAAVMKTLADHTILYDADCPLCKVYTGAFVKYRLLDADGRHPFQQLPAGWEGLVDEERAQSEIALVDKKHQRVYYGLDALFLILAHRLPWLQPLFRWQPFRWLMQRCYFFISYNRKVIAAVHPGAGHTRDCRPAFSIKYRVAYLLLAWGITSLVLSRYAPLLSPAIPPGGFYRESLVCGGQVAFQGIILYFTAREQLMDYLGHMMTVSLIGALLLLPALLVGSLLTVPVPYFFTAWFLLTAGFMLVEHLRRMKVLGLGYLPSISWVVYRLLVLAVIFSGAL